MSIRIMAMTTLTLASVVALSYLPHAVTPGPHLQTVPGVAALHAFGGRTAAQRLDPHDGKFDAALADLVVNAARARPAHLLEDLHSLSPAARFKLGADLAPMVAIDAVTRGDPGQLRAALEALGLERAAIYANDVGGWLPIGQLHAAAARAEVHALRAVMVRTRSGAVTSQGDFVQHSDLVRTTDSISGAGITVGVLSDSFDCYAAYAASGSGVSAAGYAGYAPNGFLATAATDLSTGDLPAGVSVLQEADCLDYGKPVFTPFGDEGRAMLQIVHDVAPGAALVFYTAETSEADFAAGIGKLRAAGAQVIADDVGYFDEPFFQDGLIAQAVDAVEATGVAYFTAAGNDGNAAYDNTQPSFATLATTGANAGEYLLNFDTTGATTTTALPITIDAMQPGNFTAIVVQWDQPYVTGAPGSGGATSRIDVCLTGTAGIYTVENNAGNAVTCTGANAAGVDPVQILIVANPANAATSTPKETIQLAVGLAGGTPAPGRVKVAVETDGQTDPPITTFATNSATIQGHAGAAGAATVAAAFYFQTPACGSSSAVVEPYSSIGGTTILFATDGTRLATAQSRQKPDFTAPDGGNDTFLGFTLASAGVTGSNGELSTTVTACQNDPSYPNFFGTSAATPHAAGIAALMLQANSSVTPVQIYSALETSALPMGGSAGYNVASGFGFIQADDALALIPPGTPALSVTPVAVTIGSSATLTWSSINAASCTATGAWSGSQATSGTLTVKLTSGATETYSLTCSNAAGTSSAARVELTNSAALVGNAVPQSGGGGSIDWLLLAGLAGIGARRGRRARGIGVHVHGV